MTDPRYSRRMPVRVRIVVWVAALGLVVLAAWSGYSLAYRSGQPGFYREYHDLPAIPEYPTIQVLEWLAIIAGELVLAIAILAFPRKLSLAARLVIVFAVFAVGFLVQLPLAFTAMHAPPYELGDLVFLALGAGWCLLLAIPSMSLTGEKMDS